jgi:hypothetical protein
VNEAIRKFSEQLALELKSKLSSEQTADFVKTVKASGDDRTFEVVMSTADEDRQGDSLDQSRWDLKYFALNPVVLWAHDYSSFPIGIVEDIRTEGDKTIATGKFAPAGISPEADMACALYQEKILRTVSPGYIQNDDGTRELLEMSFCPVPAGRYALSLRQVERLGVSTRDLVTKGFFYDVLKKEQVGDPCQMEDGSPGVLAESGGDPGKLVCVPTENKSNETQNMNELEKKLKEEHGRHGEAVGKHIDEFTEKCTKGEKSEGVLDKAIQEYTKAMDGEQTDHLDKCMKAIDENYELQDQAPKKSEDEKKKAIDEFKSAITDEHLTHVKACDKAIQEFKANPGYSEDEKGKAIQEFTKSMGAELDRHEKCHMDMVKAESDRMGGGEDDGEKEKQAAVAEKKGIVTDIFMRGAADREIQERMSYMFTVLYALAEASYSISSPEEFFPLAEEAMSLIAAYLEHEKNGETDAEEQAEGQSQKRTIVDQVRFMRKSGRVISAATKEKLKAILEKMVSHHTDVTAAIKELIGSEDADDGKERPAEKAAAQNPKVEVSRPSTSKMSAFDAYMLTRDILRTVNTASREGLADLNKTFSEKFPDRR